MLSTYCMHIEAGKAPVVGAAPLHALILCMMRAAANPAHAPLPQPTSAMRAPGGRPSKNARTRGHTAKRVDAKCGAMALYTACTCCASRAASCRSKAGSAAAAAARTASSPSLCCCACCCSSCRPCCCCCSAAGPSRPAAAAATPPSGALSAMRASARRVGASGASWLSQYAGNEQSQGKPRTCRQVVCIIGRLWKQHS